jgi:hypothetical protein
VHGRKHGSGCYMWATGALYDGEWEDGAMHGYGRCVSTPNRTLTNGCELTPPFRHARPIPLTHDGSPFQGLHVRRESSGAMCVVQGPFSVAPRQTLIVRFATNHWSFGG